MHARIVLLAAIDRHADSEKKCVQRLRPPGYMRAMHAGDIPTRLKELRLAAGLEQADLAERMGVSPSAVSRLETGKTEPSVKNLEAWANACGRALYIDFPSIEATEEEQAAERTLGAIHSNILDLGVKCAGALQWAEQRMRGSAPGRTVPFAGSSESRRRFAEEVCNSSEPQLRDIALSCTDLGVQLAQIRNSKPSVATRFPYPGATEAMDQLEALFSKAANAVARLNYAQERNASEDLLAHAQTDVLKAYEEWSRASAAMWAAIPRRRPNGEVAIEWIQSRFPGYLVAEDEHSYSVKATFRNTDEQYIFDKRSLEVQFVK